MDVSAKDVNQLHSKVIYFNSNKNETKSDFVFGGKDGSFENKYSQILSSPPGTKYIKLQMWIAPNPRIHSSYLIDNVNVEKFNLNLLLQKNNSGIFDFENANPQDQKMMIMINNANNTEKFLKTELLLNKSNSTNYKVIRTKLLPVDGNSVYNYKMSIEAENLNSLTGLVSFGNSDDVVTNSTKYGASASNGKVLSLSPGSEVYTDLDILKSANYTIALRAKTCESCSSSNNSNFLRVSLIEEDEDNNNNIFKTSNISLKDNDDNSNNISSSQQGLKWLYLNNTYLKKGKYEIKIHSDSQTDLDLFMLYSNNNNNSQIKDREKLGNIFNMNQSNSPYPARIADYKKINPTKFVVDVRNATRPYVMTFAESYDPLWVAHVDAASSSSSSNAGEDQNDPNPGSNENNKKNNNNSFQIRSIPLYSIINGFYINKTGDYTLTIEYEPQKWFVQAATISIITIISILAVWVLLSFRNKVLQSTRIGIIRSVLSRMSRANTKK
jgi:hypothetical protein